MVHALCVCVCVCVCGGGVDLMSFRLSGKHIRHKRLLLAKEHIDMQ